MNHPLKTMEEKRKEDPNELMENGLTRAENDRAQQGGEAVSLVLTAISVILCIYSLTLLF